ncbi:MAG: Metal dependent phosphohydrolase [Candidatus Wolfebacteria bacterium GW2011_GWC1_43_10]|uniref:Metal dependent phosphohydrolase n=1 Tax=Candidatus Wolfebacteria bacterium GW2011_GWC1_43_10 TaxID=1619011 RepID=A0A0G1CAZ7_9BACT|nr:MAG: Metal dependent phosphohydrolase [Candidatus Wolfebacteria bacterium GW2011_GWC1_43_10]KKT22917.1 MAG: Metal dependent phosphohydrolase [Parcubacteria group bacterium GW2011_GWB1_43_8b]
MPIVISIIGIHWYIGIDTVMTKDESLKILDEWVQNPNLKKHMLAVAQAMDFYARYFSQRAQISTDELPIATDNNQRKSAINQRVSVVPDKERWWIVGLLHDVDYEKYPNPSRDGTGHPYRAVEFLKDKLDEESINAVLGHASYTNTSRESLMAKTLFAVDELTGFIVAVALIKPSKSLAEVGVESVKKRFKENRFAAGVNREEIYQGAQELGVPLDEHIQNVIDAMKEISSELGL